MSIRASQIYVGTGTKRILILVAKATDGLTADELGDRLIREGLEREYPGIRPQLAEIEEIERSIVGRLRGLNALPKLSETHALLHEPPPVTIYDYPAD